MSNIDPLSEAELERYGGLFKALANPHRLRIFLRMAQCPHKGEGCSVAEDELQQGFREMASEFGLAPSTVSHHVKELRQAGLVSMRRDGQRVAVKLDQEAIGLLRGFCGLLE